MEKGAEILDHRFKVLHKIGSGAFGDIYKVLKIKSGEILAAKIEKAVYGQKHIMLFWESKLIHKLRGKTAVTNLHFVGDEKSEDGKLYHVMVMDLLGKSLEDLFQECHRKFDLKTVLQIAIQAIRIIKTVHAERIIHRDIKPDNFLIGSQEGNKNTIFLIDFGLAKCFLSSDGEHIPFRDGKNLTGTARYASLNTHNGYEQSRRDDLETFANVLAYFLRGSLPWQGLPGRSKAQKYANISRKKKEVSIEELYLGHPDEFTEFMHYCRGLSFSQEPDYSYIISLFQGCMERHNINEGGTGATSSGRTVSPDFIWNKNRLVLEKEAIKHQVLQVIRKKPAAEKINPES